MEFQKITEEVKNNLKISLNRYQYDKLDTYSLNQIIMIETCLENILALEQIYKEQLKTLHRF